MNKENGENIISPPAISLITATLEELFEKFIPVLSTVEPEYTNLKLHQLQVWTSTST